MQVILDVSGMSCAACQTRVERAAKTVPGVVRAEVNLLQNILRAEGENVNAQALIQAVENAGYGAVLHRKKQAPAAAAQTEATMLKNRFLISLLFLIPLVLLAMGPMVGLSFPPRLHTGSMYAQLLLALAVAWVNRVFFTRGLKHLVAGSPDMDSLVALGSGAALLSGLGGMIFSGLSVHVYFESAAMILTLVTLGKWLESRAKLKTTGAVAALVDLLPKSARVRRDGTEISLSTDELHAGDVLLWRAGERAAADGRVIQGAGAADVSALTGESVPQELAVGCLISAGTLLLSGYLEVRVERTGAETTLSKMITLVEQAASAKAPIARLADRVSAIFVPVVLGIALITFVGWLMAGQTLSFALTSAIAVLVISCPCALGLATPTAIMVGTGQAARFGILIKTAEIFEKACRVQAVILDKTGTVTTGKMHVARVSAACVDEQTLLRQAASLEQFSAHPFAQALMEYAQAKSYSLLPAQDFKEIPGRGVQAEIQQARVLGGNAAFMRENGIKIPQETLQQQQAAEQGCTPLFFARDKKYLGCIWFSDTVKPTAQEAVSLLRKLGVEVQLVTGDHEQTAQQVAKQIGILDVRAGVLPQEKETVVRELQEKYGRVAMVGDGINDALALARADVGIALGNGTDVAVESADIVLLQDDVRSVAGALLVSRAVLRNIRQNLFWAFFYNIIGIPLAAGIFYPALGWQLSPMFAAAAMSLSSVCVVTNALRLRFFRLPYGPKEEKFSMRKTLVIQGMMCGHCAAHVERALNALPGVEAKVDLAHHTAVVQAATEVADEVLRQAVMNAGYEVVSIQ